MRFLCLAALALLSAAPLSAQLLPFLQTPYGPSLPFADVDVDGPFSGISSADDFDAGAGLTVTDVTLWGVKASADLEETFTLVFREDSVAGINDPNNIFGEPLPGSATATFTDLTPACTLPEGMSESTGLHSYVYQVRLPTPVTLDGGFKWLEVFSSRADGVTWRRFESEPDPARGRFGTAAARTTPGEAWESMDRLSLAFALNAGDLFCPDAEGAAVPEVLQGYVDRGTCPRIGDALPASGGRCKVRVEGLNALPTAQRYTLFLRLDGPGGMSRVVFRGEVKLGPGESAERLVPVRLRQSDPAGTYVVRAFAEYGSVAALSDSALVFESVVTDPLVISKAERSEGTLRALELDDQSLSVSPNPARDRVTVRFAVAERGTATLAIYDALGREVARPLDQATVTDEGVSVDVSALPAGVYVARLIADGRAVAEPFVVVR